MYSDKEFRNNAEITSYTVYSDKFNSLYAGFDWDSVPNTMATNNPNLKKAEDDSDSAPGLQLVLAEDRKISGVVFEDTPTEDSLKNNERIGNGLREDGENKIENVTVQLVPLGDSNGKIKIDPLKSDTKTAKEASEGDINAYYNNRWLGSEHAESKLTVSTDDNGKFTLTGFVPGDYLIRYIWGRNKGTEIISIDGGKEVISVGEYKSTLYKLENDQLAADVWYLDEAQKTNWSEAKDDWETRQDVDKGRPASYKDYNTYKDGYLDQMMSYTNKLDMGVEIQENTKIKNGNVIGIYYEEDENGKIFKYNISSIDFGLIERPKQRMELKKEVEKVRIIDNQDRVVVDAQVIVKDGKKTFKNVDDVLYTVYLPESETDPTGSIKSEIDKEYLPVKLEITYKLTVTNSSEQDYKNENYYIYGHQKDNWQTNPVKLTPAGVYDYLSEKFDLMSQSEDCEYIKSVDDYNDAINDNINKKSKLYDDSKNTAETITEAGFERYATEKDSSGGTTTTQEWEKYKILKSVYERWYYNENREEKTTRDVKLEGNKILEIKKLEKSPLAAGESKSYSYSATTMVNASDSEIQLSNDAEIIDVIRQDDYGKTVMETYKTLYYQGQNAVVTSPTGGHNEDAPIDTETSILAISVASALAVLSIGIIFIKKKVINKKHKKNFKD